MRPLSAPRPCAVCSCPVRSVADAYTKETLVIDADQVGTDVGNVIVIAIEPPAALWLVEVYDNAGLPGPPSRYDANIPPPLWRVHVCPNVPVEWPAIAAAADLDAEAVAS